MMRTAGLCCVVVLAVAITGCGGNKAADTVANKVVEKAIETQASKDGKDVKAKVDLQSGSMNIVSNDGKQSVSVSTKDGQTTVTSQDGGTTAVVGKDAPVQETFPKDIPVYTGATVQISQANAADKSFVIQATTNDAVDVVGAFYKKELSAQGWTEAQTVNQGGVAPMQMLSYSKGERQLMIMIQTSDKGTVLTLQTSGSAK